MNSGKLFEKQWIKNAKKVDGLYIMRLNDSASSYGKDSSVVRFTPSNICDYLMFKSPVLFLLELKNVRTPSLPLKNIRKNQIEGLLSAHNTSDDIVAGIICNFEKSAETWFLPIEKFEEFSQSATRKSIPASYFRENGIQIANKQLRVNYDYDVAGFVEQILFLNNKTKG